MNAGRVVLAFAGALVVWALFFGRGDSPSRLAWIGGAAVCLAALVAAAACDRRVALPRVGRYGAAFVACFAGLILWQGLSVVWSVQPDRSWDYVNRGLVYLALLAFGSTVAILLAYSRSGVVIAVVVVALWLALDRKRFESLLALALGGGIGAAVVAVAVALPGVTDDKQPHAVRVHDGRLFLLAVAIAGAVVIVLARVLLRLEPASATRRRATAVLLAALAVGCAGGIVAVALHGSGATNGSPAGSYCGQSASRFACSSSDERLEWWKEAWESFEDEPLRGTGAGSFELAHRLHRAEYTR